MLALIIPPDEAVSVRHQGDLLIVRRPEGCVHERRDIAFDLGFGFLVNGFPVNPNRRYRFHKEDDVIHILHGNDSLVLAPSRSGMRSWRVRFLCGPTWEMVRATAIVRTPKEVAG